MDVLFDEVIIAAWLHDVGKFAQRADKKDYRTKELEGQLAKIQKYGNYSHQHALYTFGFLEANKDVFPDGVNVVNIIQLAANHHNPSGFYERLIAQADGLSSGSERCSIVEDATSKNDKVDTKFFEKPMLHLLSTLQLDKKQKPPYAYCKMKALDEDAILSTTHAVIGKEDYATLWTEFEQDFKKLKNLSIDNFLKALNSLLERYWWCIPSATNVDADISLYQHSKTTAAFAATLYRYHFETDSKNEVALGNNEEKKFRFLNGDISGIQKYIFDLKTTKDSAKLLRAKSFQLWALSEILAQYIVKQFGVSYANILTSAGGKFLLLIPNTEKTTNLLPQLQLEMEEYFLKEFAGNLAVIISDGVAASAKDVQKDVVMKLINSIGDNADICKQTKMQKAIQKNGAIQEQLFTDFQKNGECVKCNMFPAMASESSKKQECLACRELTKIGGGLVNASRVQLDSEKLLPFHEMVRILNKNDKRDGYSVNEYIPGLPLMYLPYTAPHKNGEENTLETFEEIAAKSKGNQKLAMFKADIDNLGLIFSSALNDRMSFSRYADLSHLLHYFFSAYFSHFVSTGSWKNGDTSVYYKDTIYTVFSGGDDLCVLGSWDSVMHFAADFRKELLKLTNNNTALTISGGIALVSPSLPVRDIAAAAEDLLEKSKARKSKDKIDIVKNAITVFETTVNWEEYESCLEDGEKIEKLLTAKKLSTGVVYKMLDLSNRAKKIESGNINELIKPTPHDRTWMSNFRYMVVRNIEPNVKESDTRKWFLKFGVDPQSMIISRIAVSYALYTQRNN